MLDPETIASNIKGLDEETRKTLGVNKVSMGASADSKVSIRQFETSGVWASMNIEWDFSAFTGKLPVDRIINEIVVPVRNSFARFAHPETMARVEELRVIIEGIRDGRSNADIERGVQETRLAFVDRFGKTFEVPKE
jgi:hypothetical protein